MKVLLTGGTGLLGGHILEVGLALGLEFKIVSRKVSKRSYLAEVLDDEKVEWVEMDLLDKESWPETLFDDIDYVVNAQGLASPFKEDIEKMKALNIVATKNLFDFAKSKGIREWVQISSISTMCDGSKENVTEDDIGKFRKTPYAESKFEIDTWLDEQNDVNVLTIHPCYMLGRWDSRPSSGSLILAMRMGKFKNFVGNIKNFVSPRDVAIGMFKALNKKCTGHYILGGENIGIEKFVDYVVEKLNLNKENFLLISQDDFEGLDITDNEKLIISEFCQAASVNDQKAKKDFNYKAEFDLNKQLDDAIEYFVSKRLLRIKKGQ